MALHDSADIRSDSPGSEDSGDLRPDRRLGHYLLFERTSRDPLGECHRAGRLTHDGRVERLVSLRLFDGSGIDAERFRSAAEARADAAAALAGAPPFAETLEIGSAEEVAFVASDHWLGRNLAELLTRVRERPSPVPLEHALYVMDRIALALEVARETRHEGRRLHHGFLVPAFVQLSSEGELRLSGFEAAAGLLDLPAAAGARAELAGYLSPEVAAGEPEEASDDVYSLGAIFFELLTGEPLPPLSESGAAQWIEGAVLAADATPLPEPIAELLRRTLAPRERRLPSAEAWRQALGQLITGGGYAPTTFNLAFFMHTLFRDELEREAELVEEELRATAPPLGPRPLPAPSEPAAESGEPEAEPIEEPEGAEPEPSFSAAAGTATGGAKRRWLLPAAIVLVAALAGAAYLFFGAGAAPAPAGEPTVKVSELPAPVPRFPAERTGGALDDPAPQTVVPAIEPPPTPEELEEQVRGLVEQRAETLESTLKAEYDARLVELRQQLEEARQAAARPAPEPEPQAQPPGQADRSSAAAAGERLAAAEAGRDRAGAGAAVEPGRSAPTASPGSDDAAPAAATAGGPAAETALGTAGREAAATAQSPASTARGPTVADPAAGAAATTTTAAEPPEPEPVSPGDLVSPGPGVSPPVLERHPRPEYPPAAMRLGKRATVRLRVLVDEQGNPAAIEQISDQAGFGFDRAALTAVRKARWTPATKDGVQVRMWVDLSIDFRP